MVLRLRVQCVQRGLHPQQPPGQRQQQAHHLVQVADEHAELVHLVGFTHRHHHALHLRTEDRDTAGDHWSKLNIPSRSGFFVALILSPELTVESWHLVSAGS